MSNILSVHISVSVVIPEACVTVATSEARVVRVVIQELLLHLISLLFFLLLLYVCPCDNV